MSMKFEKMVAALEMIKSMPKKEKQIAEVKEEAVIVDEAPVEEKPKAKKKKKEESEE